MSSDALFFVVVWYLVAAVASLLALYVVIRLAVTHAMVGVLNRVNLSALRSGPVDDSQA